MNNSNIKTNRQLREFEEIKKRMLGEQLQAFHEKFGFGNVVIDELGAGNEYQMRYYWEDEDKSGSFPFSIDPERDMRFWGSTYVTPQAHSDGTIETPAQALAGALLEVALGTPKRDVRDKHSVVPSPRTTKDGTRMAGGANDRTYMEMVKQTAFLPDDLKLDVFKSRENQIQAILDRFPHADALPNMLSEGKFIPDARPVYETMYGVSYDDKGVSGLRGGKGLAGKRSVMNRDPYSTFRVIGDNATESGAMRYTPVTVVQGMDVGHGAGFMTTGFAEDNNIEWDKHFHENISVEDMRHFTMNTSNDWQDGSDLNIGQLGKLAKSTNVKGAARSRIADMYASVPYTTKGAELIKEKAPDAWNKLTAQDQRKLLAGAPSGRNLSSDYFNAVSRLNKHLPGTGYMLTGGTSGADTTREGFADSAIVLSGRAIGTSAPPTGYAIAGGPDAKMVFAVTDRFQDLMSEAGTREGIYTGNLEGIKSPENMIIPSIAMARNTGKEGSARFLKRRWDLDPSGWAWVNDRVETSHGVWENRKRFAPYYDPSDEKVARTARVMAGHYFGTESGQQELRDLGVVTKLGREYSQTMSVSEAHKYENNSDITISPSKQDGMVTVTHKNPDVFHLMAQDSYIVRTITPGSKNRSALPGHQIMESLHARNPQLANKLLDKGFESNKNYRSLFASYMNVGVDERKGTRISVMDLHEKANSMYKEETGIDLDGRNAPGSYMARAAQKLYDGDTDMIIQDPDGNDYRMPSPNTLAGLSDEALAGGEDSAIVNAANSAISLSMNPIENGRNVAEDAYNNFRGVLHEEMISQNQFRKGLQPYRMDEGRNATVLQSGILEPGEALYTGNAEHREILRSMGINISDWNDNTIFMNTSYSGITQNADSDKDTDSVMEIDGAMVVMRSPYTHGGSMQVLYAPGDKRNNTDERIVDAMKSAGFTQDEIDARMANITGTKGADRTNAMREVWTEIADRPMGTGTFGHINKVTDMRDAMDQALSGSWMQKASRTANTVLGWGESLRGSFIGSASKAYVGIAYNSIQALTNAGSESGVSANDIDMLHRQIGQLNQQGLDRPPKNWEELEQASKHFSMLTTNALYAGDKPVYSRDFTIAHHEMSLGFDAMRRMRDGGFDAAALVPFMGGEDEANVKAAQDMFRALPEGEIPTGFRRQFFETLFGEKGGETQLAKHYMGSAFQRYARAQGINQVFKKLQDEDWVRTHGGRTKVTERLATHMANNPEDVAFYEKMMGFQTLTANKTVSDSENPRNILQAVQNFGGRVGERMRSLMPWAKERAEMDDLHQEIYARMQEIRDDPERKAILEAAREDHERKQKAKANKAKQAQTENKQQSTTETSPEAKAASPWKSGSDLPWSGENPSEFEGWKMHLNLGGANSSLARDVGTWLSGSGYVHKVGRSSDQDGKDATIYAGSRNAAQAIAKKLNNRFGDKLLAPGKDTLANDIQIDGNIYGRFEAGGEWDQYGIQGWSDLKEHRSADIINIRHANTDEERENALNYQRINHDISRQKLVDKFGEYFTGDPVDTRTTNDSYPLQGPTGTVPNLPLPLIGKQGEYTDTEFQAARGDGTPAEEMIPLSRLNDFAEYRSLDYAKGSSNSGSSGTGSGSGGSGGGSGGSGGPPPSDPQDDPGDSGSRKSGKNVPPHVQKMVDEQKAKVQKTKQAASGQGIELDSQLGTIATEMANQFMIGRGVYDEFTVKVDESGNARVYMKQKKVMGENGEPTMETMKAKTRDLEPAVDNLAESFKELEKRASGLEEGFKKATEVMDKFKDGSKENLEALQEFKTLKKQMDSVLKSIPNMGGFAVSDGDKNDAKYVSGVRRRMKEASDKVDTIINLAESSILSEQITSGPKKQSLWGKINSFMENPEGMLSVAGLGGVGWAMFAKSRIQSYMMGPAKEDIDMYKEARAGEATLQRIIGGVGSIETETFANSNRRGYYSSLAQVQSGENLAGLESWWQQSVVNNVMTPGQRGVSRSVQSGAMAVLGTAGDQFINYYLANKMLKGQGGVWGAGGKLAGAISGAATGVGGGLMAGAATIAGVMAYGLDAGRERRDPEQRGGFKSMVDNWINDFNMRVDNARFLSIDDSKEMTSGQYERASIINRIREDSLAQSELRYGSMEDRDKYGAATAKRLQEFGTGVTDWSQLSNGLVVNDRGDLARAVSEKGLDIKFKDSDSLISYVADLGGIKDATQAARITANVLSDFNMTMEDTEDSQGPALKLLRKVLHMSSSEGIDADQASSYINQTIRGLSTGPATGRDSWEEYDRILDLSDRDKTDLATGMSAFGNQLHRMPMMGNNNYAQQSGTLQSMGAALNSMAPVAAQWAQELYAPTTEYGYNLSIAQGLRQGTPTMDVNTFLPATWDRQNALTDQGFQLQANQAIYGFEFQEKEINRSFDNAKIFRDMDRNWQRYQYGVQRQSANIAMDQQRASFGRQMEMTGIRYEDMLAGQAHQTTMFGFQIQQQEMGWGHQRADMDLRRSQAQESFGMQMAERSYQRNMMMYNFDYQAETMDIARDRQIESRDWQNEDLAYSREMAGIQFAWGQEDSNRNIRLATGRQKREMIRQRDRNQIVYAMEEGQRNRQGDRVETQQGWEDEDYGRGKEHFEETRRMQTEYFDMQTSHAERNHAMQMEYMDQQRSQLEEVIRLQQEVNVVQEAEMKRSQESQKKLTDLQIADDKARMADEEFNHARRLQIMENEYEEYKRQFEERQRQAEEDKAIALADNEERRAMWKAGFELEVAKLNLVREQEVAVAAMHANMTKVAYEVMPEIVKAYQDLMNSAGGNQVEWTPPTAIPSVISGAMVESAIQKANGTLYGGETGQGAR